MNVASNNILVPAEDPAGEQRKFPYLDGIEDNMQVFVLFVVCICVLVLYGDRVRRYVLSPGPTITVVCLRETYWT